MKKITVSIGIPAFNEEQNIEAFLRSIVAQEVQQVAVEQILVYSDDSSDNTNDIVSSLAKKYPQIKLIKGKSRKGKYFRVNELFHLNKSDVLIILDADIALVGEKFIETLATEFYKDPKALMMGANNILIRTKGFIPHLLHTHFSLWDFIRINAPDEEIADNFYGSATAYRKSFAHSLHIPTNTTDPHFFIFLSAKKLNGFRYTKKAGVLQYPPSTIADLKKLLNRTIGKRDEVLEEIFGVEMIKNAYVIPTRAKLIGLWKCFLWDPLYTPLAILLSIYLSKMVHPKKVNKTAIWEINTSTKKPIAYAK